MLQEPERQQVEVFGMQTQQLWAVQRATASDLPTLMQSLHAKRTVSLKLAPTYNLTVAFCQLGSLPPQALRLPPEIQDKLTNKPGARLFTLRATWSTPRQGRAYPLPTESVEVRLCRVAEGAVTDEYRTMRQLLVRARTGALGQFTPAHLSTDPKVWGYWVATTEPLEMRLLTPTMVLGGAGRS